MVDHTPLPHVMVTGRSEHADWKPSNSRPHRDLRQHSNPSQHGQRLGKAINTAFERDDEKRALLTVNESLLTNGNIIVLHSYMDFRIDLDPLSLKNSVDKWKILNIKTIRSDEGLLRQEIILWVSHKARREFLGRFELYSNDPTRYRGLVANIEDVRNAFLDDMWSSFGEPEFEKETWWTLLLDRTEYKPDIAKETFNALEIKASFDSVLNIGDVVSLQVRATWQQLGVLLRTKVPLVEIRRPQFLERSVAELSEGEQAEYVNNLSKRIIAAESGAPAVCHLDSGVLASHNLLSTSLDAEDAYSVDGLGFRDDIGHGTKMAAIALLGADIDELMVGTQEVRLSHRLESVKVISDKRSARSSKDAARVTMEAVARPEVERPKRSRVFCMPVSLKEHEAPPGEPSLWSASLDALAVGRDNDPDPNPLTTQHVFQGPPNPSASRLLIVSAGNVDTFSSSDYDPGSYLESCDEAWVEDPGQAWNVLTVGAFTERTEPSHSPEVCGLQPVAPKGGLSPHSRTSVGFAQQWPIKPEICLEGGNLLYDASTGGSVTAHPSIEITTASSRNNSQLDSANATSAATAQAARLAAMVMARYPEYWPETVRGLLVHEAQWTQAMTKDLTDAKSKKAKAELLRRFGWGVPSETRVLSSDHHSVTMIIQDEFEPLNNEFKFSGVRLHRLPWPTRVLQDLAGERVKVRVTLSYFIEPSIRRRGWANRYAYASHGLHFEMQSPEEATLNAFCERVRIAKDAQDNPTGRRDTSDVDWLIGKRQRNRGSLHQDEWEADASQVAASRHIAIYPTGGWWKNNRRKDRRIPVRYSLIVTLTAMDSQADLYTPITSELTVPVETEILI